MHLDIETYSEADLKGGGVYVYADHESTEALVIVYAIGDRDPTCWIPVVNVPGTIIGALQARLMKKFGREIRIATGTSVPEELRQHIEAGGEVAAHNAQFERVVLNGKAGRKIDFPYLKIDQMVCTAAKARAAGLPGALGDACKALGTHAKDETGKGPMLYLCRPRKGAITRYTFEEEPEKYVHLYAYCVDDVFAERGLDDVVPDLPPSELDVWRMDQRINDRGVGVDLVSIDHVESLISQYKIHLVQRCSELTRPDKNTPGLAPTQREKIALWIREHGYPQLEDMQAETVLQVVKDPTCPEDCKTLLRLYSTYNMKAVTKYAAMVAACGTDARVRGMFMYYGAGTGRWSSMIVQLQNLFRPLIKDSDVAIDAFSHRDLDFIRFLYDIDPMKVFASCVRGMLIPKKGSDLIALDFAGIESRKIVWLFDEEWKIQAFRDADREPKKYPDNYKLAYGRGFGVDPMSILKDDPRRQVGKVMELAFGFEGGVGACVTMADTYRVDLAELARAALPAMPIEARESAEWMWENWECKKGNPSGLPYEQYVACDGLKQIWRNLHPNVKQGWKDTIEAAKLAVLNPGQAYAIPNRKLIFMVKGNWLYMRLPSGRKLAYYKPELHQKTPKDKWGSALKETQEIEDELPGLETISVEQWAQAAYIDNGTKYLNLTYMGVDSRTRQWVREGTYGGKLVENAVQASSRDLLVNGMFKMEAAGYPIIMTVHDEIVAEVMEEFGSLHEAERIMCDIPAWAAGMPMAAEGFRAKRYRK